MSLFQLTLLEHLQISFTLVAFTSVRSSSSPCTSWMCLQIISQVSPPTGITLNLISFPFQPTPSFQSSSQSSIPIFSPQMATVILESWLPHSPHTSDVSKGCHILLFILIYNFFLIPSAKSFPWTYFCLIYRDPPRQPNTATTTSCNPPRNPGGFAVITVTISQPLAFKHNELQLTVLTFTSIDLTYALTPCPVNPTLNNSSAFHQE